MTERMVPPASPPQASPYPTYLVVDEVPTALAPQYPYDPNSASPSPGEWRGDRPGDETTAAPVEAADRAGNGPPPYYPDGPGGPGGLAPGNSGPAARGSDRRLRLVPRTLATRLVAGVVLLVVFVVLATGAGTYVALGQFLNSRLNQQVGSVASAVATTPARSGGLAACIAIAPAPCELVRDGANSGGFGGSSARAVQKQWVALLDPSGNALALHSEISDIYVMTLTAGQRTALLHSAAAYRSWTFDGQSVRVTARVIPSGFGAGYIAVTGLSTHDVTNTLHTLLLFELIIGGGAILLALGATTVGVRLSLRPLYRVTNTARAVTAELSPEGAGLERRVPVSATEIDTEVGQLADSVNTLLGAVGTQFAARVESEQRMRQFMADASHELRTPLTSIRGYAELARMQRASDDGGDQAASRDRDAEALARIESEGTRMSRLVDDLLTLARGDIGAPIEAGPVYLAELIEDAVEGVRAAHPGRQVAFSAAPDLVTRGDPDQLLRVVRNLLTNAAVHAVGGGPIRVTCVAEGPFVVIRVIDSGPGLPPEQAAHVFERFWRSDRSRSRASGGSGLGLPIVASIVAAHGGVVWFDSSVAAGSTVTVSLPAY